MENHHDTLQLAQGLIPRNSAEFVRDGHVYVHGFHVAGANPRSGTRKARRLHHFTLGHPWARLDACASNRQRFFEIGESISGCSTPLHRKPHQRSTARQSPGQNGVHSRPTRLRPDDVSGKVASDDSQAWTVTNQTNNQRTQKENHNPEAQPINAPCVTLTETRGSGHHAPRQLIERFCSRRTRDKMHSH